MTFLLAFERPFGAIVHRWKKCSRQKNPEGEDEYGNQKSRDQYDSSGSWAIGAKL